MTDNTRLAVLSGSLASIPKPPSRIVRIFLSSTFGDTTAERNYLHKKAFPELTDWCREKHVDFQVVDMRWGVRDEATAEHMTTELCIREIRNCQRLSIGPNFMFFLGQRYGYRALQPLIKAREFDILLNHTNNIEDAGLLKEWFVKDDNAVPPVYLLRPITEDVKDSWDAICKRLTLILRRSSSEAAEKGLLSQRDKHEYFMSVTEEEVRAALETTNINDNTFGFIRNMHNMTNSLEDPLAKRYCDMDGEELDVEASDLLDSFKSEYVPSRLSSKNLHYYDIEWTENGVNVQNVEHVQYLEQFCKAFVENCKCLIRRAIQTEKSTKPVCDKLFLEVAHHAEFCKSKCQNFCGRKELIEEVYKSLKRKDFQKPIVLYGVSGSGKTSIMAMIAKKAYVELGKNTKIIFRFLGTTPESSSISMVIHSMCQQIIAMYGFDIEMPSLFDQFTDLVDFFQLLLQNVSDKCKGQTLLIILDSLDQLEGTHNAYQCRWLPRTCPPNVKLVLSTLPELHGILESLKRLLVGATCFYPVEGLPNDTMDEILDVWMGEINRKVTDEQKGCIKTAFAQCPQPLFLKLAFEQAKLWNSNTEVRQEDLATTVRAAIWQLFERLERQYGNKLVSHALGYIVASRSGLSQQELEDVLSLDDEVLDEIYQYHQPPNPAAIRIPTLLWSRLKYELQEYMVDRQADGKTVSVLYHRQFIEAAFDRYLSDPEVLKVRHQLLADYFSGKWSQGVKKPLHLTQLNETLLDADRSVPTQPLKYREMYNHRKICELPYHLLHAQNIQELIQETFGNFAFVDGMVSSKSTRYLLDELQMVLSHPDILGQHLIEELEIIMDTFRLAKPTLDFENNDQPVACELLGRLSHMEETRIMCIKPLVEGARRWYQGTSGLFLIPQRSCFPTPGEPLRTTYTGHKSNVRDMKVSRSDNMLATASEDGTVRVWDLTTDEVIHVLKLPRVGEIWKVCISPDNKWAVSIIVPANIQVWSLKTGEAILTIPGFYADVVITQDSKQIVAAHGYDLKVFDITTGQVLNTIHNDAGPFKKVMLCMADKAVIGISKISQQSSIEICPSASDVMASTAPEQVMIWSLETRECLHTVLKKTAIKMILVDLVTGVLVMAGKSNGVVICKLPTFFDNNNSRINVQMFPCASLDTGRVTAIHLDAECLYGGDTQGNVYVWDVTDGQLKQTVVVGGCQISSLAITEGNRHLLCGTYDGSIHVIQLSTMTAIQSLKGQQADVNQILLVGNILISASTQSQYIKIWDLSDAYLAHKPQTLPCKSGLGEFTVAVNDEEVFYVEMTEDTGQTAVKVWNRMSMSERKVPIESEGNIKFVEVCNNRQHLLCGFEDGKIGMYDVDKGEQMCHFEHEEKELHLLKLRRDNKVLVAKMTGAIYMWNVETQECIRTWTHQDVEVYSGLVITKDDDVICSDAETGCSTLVVLRKASDEHSVMRLFPSERVEKVGPMELNSSSTMLAVGLESSTGLMDAKTFDMIWKTEMGNAQPWNLSFAQNGQILIVGTSFKNIKLLSTNDGTIITSIYIYSSLLKLISSDNAIYGVTYIGQFIALKLHGEALDSRGIVQKPIVNAIEANTLSRLRPQSPVVALSEVSLNSNSSDGSKRSQGKKSSSICVLL